MSKAGAVPLTPHNPVEILQRLIQFDTSNPPGNEAECIAFINQLLTQAGIETRLLAKSSSRPNLIARLPGRGNSPPLLLYGHVDVVPAENEGWQQPPFSGVLADGCVWGSATGALISGGRPGTITSSICLPCSSTKVLTR